MEKQQSMNPYDLKIRIINVLHEIGVPASVKGYLYLQEALAIAVADSNAIFHMTSAIYAPVAERFEITSSGVRKSIAQAIEIAWDRGDLDTLKRYFGYTISNVKGKPTNTEFIALIAECLRLQMVPERTLPLYIEEGLPRRSAFMKEK